AAEYEALPALAADRVEVDDGEDVHVRLLLRGEARRPAGTVDRAVGREEDEGVRERDALCGRRRGVRARKLDERCSPRRVVVQPGAGAAVVPVRHDDDLLPWREACLFGDEVDERRAPAVDPGREPLGANVEAVRLELPAEPCRGTV